MPDEHLLRCHNPKFCQGCFVFLRIQNLLHFNSNLRFFHRSIKSIKVGVRNIFNLENLLFVFLQNTGRIFEIFGRILEIKVCQFKKNGVCKLLVLLKIIFRSKRKLFYLLNIAEKLMNLQCDASCKYYVSINGQ